MVETRANPTTQQLELKHPELGIWVQAVATLLVEGGFEVLLAGAQASLLAGLANNAEALPDIDAKMTQLSQLLTTSNNLVNALSGTRIDAILQALTLILQATPSAQHLADIRAALNGASSINTLLSSINTNRFAELQVSLAALDENLENLLASSNKLTPESAAIVNVTLTNANTQYSYLIPQGTKRLAFKCRGDTSRSDVVSEVRYSWVPDKVAGGVGGQGLDAYDVLPFGVEECSDQYFAVDRRIYFAAPTAGVVLSVRRWS